MKKYILIKRSSLIQIRKKWEVMEERVRSGSLEPNLKNIRDRHLDTQYDRKDVPTATCSESYSGYNRIHNHGHGFPHVHDDPGGRRATHKHGHGFPHVHDDPGGRSKAHKHGHGFPHVHDDPGGRSHSHNFEDDLSNNNDKASADCPDHDIFGYDTVDNIYQLSKNSNKSNGLVWGYFHTKHHHDEEEEHKHSDCELESIMLFVFNSKLSYDRGEEDRKVYYKVKKAALKIDDDKTINIKIACDFSKIPHVPTFPKKHFFIDPNDVAKGWK